jgi:hypothetical protein
MSFEGYCITVCQHGHLLEEDYDYAGDQAAKVCPVCGAPWAWNYTVDQTNDAGVAPVLEVYQADPAGREDHDVYYLPGPDDSRTERGYPVYVVPDENSPPLKAAMWQDLNHPDDGPFTTDHEAWDNKWNYYRRAERARIKAERLANKAAMKQRRK